MTSDKITVILVVIALTLLVFSIAFNFLVNSRTSLTNNNPSGNNIKGNPQGHVSIILLPHEGNPNITK